MVALARLVGREGSWRAGLTALFADPAERWTRVINADRVLLVRGELDAATRAAVAPLGRVGDVLSPAHVRRPWSARSVY